LSLEEISWRPVVAGLVVGVPPAQLGRTPHGGGGDDDGGGFPGRSATTSVARGSHARPWWPRCNNL